MAFSTYFLVQPGTTFPEVALPTVTEGTWGKKWRSNDLTMGDCLDSGIRSVQKKWRDWCHAWNVTQSHGNAVAKAKAEFLEVICEGSVYLTDTNPLMHMKQSLEFTVFNNRDPFRLYWLSGSARPKGSMTSSGSPALHCTDCIYTAHFYSFNYNVFLFLFFTVLGIEPRALLLLSKHCPTEPHPSSTANF